VAAPGFDLRGGVTVVMWRGRRIGEGFNAYPAFPFLSCIKEFY